MRAYLPLSAAGKRADVFGEQDFRHDAAVDTYDCPGDRVPRFLSQTDATQRRIYQATATNCKACALRARCTTSPRGRRISRDLDETYLDRVRDDQQTAAHAKTMPKRKVWVETLFAEAKAWPGLRRLRLRGLDKVNGAPLVIATGQNLKRLLSERGWGRRPWPGGAAGVGLATATLVIIGMR